jgi:hypothetical protein
MWFVFKPILHTQLNSSCQDLIYMQTQFDKKTTYLIQSA